MVHGQVMSILEVELVLTPSVITGSLTLILALTVYFFFPDSPLNAHFLTPKERAQAILRIKSNHSGIEQKRFKRYQYATYLDLCIVMY